MQYPPLSSIEDRKIAAARYTEEHARFIAKIAVTDDAKKTLQPIFEHLRASSTAGEILAGGWSAKFRKAGGDKKKLCIKSKKNVEAKEIRAIEAADAWLRKAERETISASNISATREGWAQHLATTPLPKPRESRGIVAANKEHKEQIQKFDWATDWALNADFDSIKQTARGIAAANKKELDLTLPTFENALAKAEDRRDQPGQHFARLVKLAMAGDNSHAEFNTQTRPSFEALRDCVRAFRAELALSKREDKKTFKIKGHKVKGKIGKARLFIDNEACFFDDSEDFMAAEHRKIEKKIIDRPEFGIVPGGQHHQARKLRALDWTWWGRKLRTQAARTAEMHFIRRKEIGGKKGETPYCSKHGQALRKKQIERNLAFLSERFAKNDVTGEEINIGLIAKLSAERRFAKLFAIVKGWEKFTEEKKLTIGMMTLTAPKRFHPNPKMGENSWDNSDIKAGQEWLVKHWASLRAILNNKDIKFDFLRVAESHEDACVHWHIMLVCTDEDIEEILKIANRPKCFGHSKIAVDWKKSDPAKGKFSSYIFKYISKSLVGCNKNLPLDHPDREAVLPDAMDAWRAIHGINAFHWSQSGRMGLWDECRRLGRINAWKKQSNEYAAVTAATAGDGYAFLLATGGLNCYPVDATEELKVHREKIKTGYQEVGYKVIGITINGKFIETRQGWTISTKKADEVDPVTLISNAPRQVKNESQNLKTDPVEDDLFMAASREPQRQVFI